MNTEHNTYVEKRSGDGLYYVWCSTPGCDFDHGTTPVESEAAEWAANHDASRETERVAENRARYLNDQARFPANEDVVQAEIQRLIGEAT